ncbi:hypothetical protein TIFTF001_017404 [Ficus carica]|uniref:Uncharacterized protein n=1 Tax=Ficus carica TaxID=3494 RepID=A0AA88A251_FICCA|nr:hypothetical protein TIFTF001_017404 [Ficus carica]
MLVGKDGFGSGLVTFSLRLIENNHILGNVSALGHLALLGSFRWCLALLGGNLPGDLGNKRPVNPVIVGLVTVKHAFMFIMPSLYSAMRHVLNSSEFWYPLTAWSRA